MAGEASCHGMSKIFARTLSQIPSQVAATSAIKDDILLCHHQEPRRRAVAATVATVANMAKSVAGADTVIVSSLGNILDFGCVKCVCADCKSRGDGYSRVHTSGRADRVEGERTNTSSRNIGG
jgi:hypothetical protein